MVEIPGSDDASNDRPSNPSSCKLDKTISVAVKSVFHNTAKNLDTADRTCLNQEVQTQLPRLLLAAKIAGREDKRKRLSCQHRDGLERHWQSLDAALPKQSRPPRLNDDLKNMGVNFLSRLHTITQHAVSKGIKLSSLWEPGCWLHDASHASLDNNGNGDAPPKLTKEKLGDLSKKLGISNPRHANACANI
ncbi:hypothetical protein EsH8_XIII_000016 [Colletotrichum jinshuiense]